MERESIAFDSVYPNLYVGIPTASPGPLLGASARARSSAESLHQYDVISGEEFAHAREEEEEAAEEGASGERVVRKHVYEFSEAKYEWNEQPVVGGSSPGHRHVSLRKKRHRESHQCGARDCVTVCGVTATIVLAVVSLAVSGLLWFGRAGPGCGCPGSNDLEETLKYLQQVNDDLEEQLTHIQNAAVTLDELTGSISSFEGEVGRLNSSLMALRNSATDDEMVTATQHNVSRPDTCPRVREAKCGSAQGHNSSLGRQLQCNTSSVATHLNASDATAKTVYCARLDDPPNGYTYHEGNSSETALQPISLWQEIHCWCEEVDPGEVAGLAGTDQVVCGLFVSRCPPHVVN